MAACRGAFPSSCSRNGASRSRRRTWPSASAPAIAERLLSAPLIHDSDASGWRTWFAAHGLDYRPRPQDRRFEDYNLVLDAAACGLGIALARPPLAHGPMETGRLVQVDQRTVLNPVSYWLDRPNGTIRGAAATLAKRVAEEAGMSPDVLAGFLKADRK